MVRVRLRAATSAGYANNSLYVDTEGCGLAIQGTASSLSNVNFEETELETNHAFVFIKQNM